MPLDLFPWHPRFVHFPIAFALAGVALTLAGFWRHDLILERAGFWSLLAGWISAVIAALAGVIDIGQIAPDDPRWDSLNTHISAGVLLIILLGGTLYWRQRQQRGLTPETQQLYSLLLVVVAIAVLVDGWLGGQLVYHLRLGVQ